MLYTLFVVSSSLLVSLVNSLMKSRAQPPMMCVFLDGSRHRLDSSKVAVILCMKRRWHGREKRRMSLPQAVPQDQEGEASRSAVSKESRDA